MLKLLSAPTPPGPPQTANREDDLLELVAGVLCGEACATRTFVVALGPSLLRVVRRVLGKRHPDIEDVTQEAMFAVLHALPRYRGECSVLHFACRIAVLCAMNARRKSEAAKRSSLRPSEGDLEAFAADDAGPDSRLSARATAGAVRGLLSALPSQQAEALALHCVLGYTVAEIAAVASVPQETVRSRLKHARRALRERLNADPQLRELVRGTR